MLGPITASFAHDFNNLLTVILMRSVALMRGEPRDPTWRDGLQDIYEAAQCASSITRHVLATTREEPMQPRNIDLNRVIDSVLSVLRVFMRGRGELVFEPGDGLAIVRGDRAQLGQVVLNLVKNAAEALDEPGVVRIATANVEIEDGPVRGRCVRLTVSDNGRGIEPCERERVFRSGYTTKVGGTGVGLATVMRVVRECCGHVEVDSEVGRGTTFQLYLPARAVSEAA
jgi:signal transduction histidine kinase